MLIRDQIALEIDGRKHSGRVIKLCAERSALLKRVANITPHLAVLLVGEDSASKLYVANKIRACEKAGVRSSLFQMPSTASQEEILTTLCQLNCDPSVHGILVQLPLPAHVNVPTIIQAIAPQKDVDGFHFYNVGSLVCGMPTFAPCTPFGVMRLLEYENIELEGLNAVIVGASNIVGKPMAHMLMQKGATVTICHAKTRELSPYTLLADLVVVAAGVPGLIKAEMIKLGACVVDVGINRLPSGRICGDVDYEHVRLRASRITPVPGGVGPMTVAMLIENTICSAENAMVRATAEAAAH